MPALPTARGTPARPRRAECPAYRPPRAPPDWCCYRPWLNPSNLSYLTPTARTNDRLTHVTAPRPAGGPHRRPEHGGRPRGGVVPLVHGARRVRPGADALRARRRLDLAAGIGALRARHPVHVGGGMDARRRRARARRYLLCRRRAAHQGRGRSSRRAAAVAAVRADLAGPVVALRRPLVGDLRGLARDQRHAGGVP